MQFSEGGLTSISMERASGFWWLFSGAGVWEEKYHGVAGAMGGAGVWEEKK